VGRKPEFIEMVAMDVGDIEVIGRFDSIHQVGGKLIIAGEDAPGTMEGGEKPWITHN
jgi:hypothetical protein